MDTNIISKNAKPVAAAAANKPKTMQDYIKVMQPEFTKVLPSMVKPDHFVRMLLSQLSVNPKLAECTPKSFLGAAMLAAQSGCEPGGVVPTCYFIPYNNHGTLECQFQLSYKGMIELVYRSGQVSVIQAHVVYENDEFEYEFGLEPKLHHKPAIQDRGKPIAYYAMFKLKDGGFGFECMSQADVEAHARKYSKAVDRGPWKTDFEAMALKTVLRKCLKFAPIATETARVMQSDESIKTTLTEDMFSVPDETVMDVEYEVVPETGEVIG